MEEVDEYVASKLPIDVIHVIVKAVAALPPVIATRALLSLCLVSHSWLVVAQPALYHSPYFSFDAPDTTPPRTYSRLSSFLATLVSRPDLAKTVRAFELGTYTARCQAEAKVDRRLVSRMSLELVRTCANLREVSFPFVTMMDKSDLVLALRRLENLEAFTFGEGASTVDPWVINVNPAILDEWGSARWTMDDFRSLGQCWPRLRRVVLQARVRVLDRPDEREHVGWQLECFELALIRNAKVGISYLDRLLSGSRTSLRRLTLKEHQIHSADLVQLLETYGPMLEHLATSSADQHHPNLPLLEAIATHCPRLRVLELGSPVHDLLPTLTTLALLPNLHHLTLGALYATALPGGREALVHVLQAFERLELLDLVPLSRSPEESVAQQAAVGHELAAARAGSGDAEMQIEADVQCSRWRVRVRRGGG
ncbi:hypothetical protein JCM21900_003394 [Sporobolomyces salmonicolor]